MIHITIVRDRQKKRIVSFEISGHADFARKGEDIVCSAISAISVGTVNSIETLTGLELPAQMKDGWLQSEVPQLADAAVDAKAQLLLESMVVMLDTVQQSYGDYVVIHQ
ncbi:ribosomal-processing cysteine protease Prp [Paenibacillaceae bacterium]|nr:ribosomal-processing cysteine protease Prp [Paenibacillaceae bacterium]